jgi:hypothetical protein
MKIVLTEQQMEDISDLLNDLPIKCGGTVKKITEILNQGIEAGKEQPKEEKVK